jgi:hypothetical protein
MTKRVIYRRETESKKPVGKGKYRVAGQKKKIKERII